MEKILTILLSTAVLIACFCGCEEENKIQATTRITTTEQEVIESSKTEVSESAEDKGYQFMLGNDESTVKSIKLGDEIGGWTMSEIGSYSLNHPNDPSYVQVTFTGEVALKGKISEFGNMLTQPNGHLQFIMDNAENIPVYVGDERVVWAEIQNNFEDLKDDLGVETVDCDLEVEVIVSNWQVNYLPMECWDKITIKRVIIL